MPKKIFVLFFGYAIIMFFSLMGGVSYLNAKLIEGNFSSIQYDEYSELSGLPGAKIQKKVYIKGDKMRAENKVTGVIEFIIGDKFYQYNPVTNEATFFYISQGKEFTSNLQRIMKIPNKEKIGEEMIEGRLCDVYKYADEKGILKKVWIAKDIDLQVKIEMGIMREQLKNIIVNPYLDDSLFELPAGAQIKDASTIVDKLLSK